MAAATTAVLAAANPAWAGDPQDPGPTLSLEIQDGSECVGTQGQIFVILRMSNIDPAGPGAAGYQAFVEFDHQKLNFVSGKYLNSPFGLPVAQPIAEDPSGLVTLAAGIDVFGGQQPTFADADLAILEFAAKDENCAINLDFCRVGCQENIITDINAQPLPGLELVKSADITVDGTAPRIMACCPDVKLKANDACLALVPDLTGCVTAKDNCPDNPLSVSQFPAANTPLGLGTTYVTIRVTDCAGNSASCQTAVTVNDTTPPVIHQCPGNRTLKSDNDCKTRVPDLRNEVSAKDNCDNPSLLTITQDPAPDTEIGLGNTMVTITVTDNFGNSSTCAARLDVIDARPPKIAVCPNDLTLKADPGCGAIVPKLTNKVVAIDNCTLAPNLLIEQDPPAGTPLQGQGSTVVTVTVTDQVGLSDTCQIVVTVIDNTPPVIQQCAQEVTLPLDGNCRASMPDLTAGVIAADNCSKKVTITQSKPVGSNILGQGTIFVTITATDDKGNASTCEVGVTTVDEMPPTITQCSNDVKIPANELCQAVVPQLFGGVVAVDNCSSSVTITQEPAPGTVIEKGITPVTLIATDNKGNKATCVANVIVFDDIDPVLSCPENIVAECTGPEGAFISFADQISATDNCDPKVDIKCFELGDSGPVGVINPTGQMFPNKERTIILCTAEDNQGNVSECIFTVTVVDSTAPVIEQCPTSEPLKVEMQPLPGQTVPVCQAQVPDLRSMVVASDLCDTNPTVTQNPPVGSNLSGQGTYLVTMTVTDNSGNAASCKVTLLVVDNQPPVFTRCSNDVKIKAGSQCTAQIPNLLIGVSAEDNCSTSVEITQDPAPNTKVGLGVHTVTFTATDIKGNASQCAVTVTVNDQTDPKIFFCPEDQTLEVDARCEAVVPLLVAEALDNCNAQGDLVVTQDPEAGTVIELGVTPVIVTVTDKAGNSDSCEVVLTVVDVTPPSIACPPDRSAKARKDMCSALVELGEPKADDNCGLEKVSGQRSDGLSLEAAYPLGTTTVTWTAKDESGNQSQCVQTVTVTDNLPPQLTCPPDRSFNADPGVCTKKLDPGQATARDNCDSNVKIEGIRSDGLDLDDLYPSGLTTITWTAVDDAGNTSVCEQDINVSKQNTFVVDIDIAKTVHSPVTRCITFELWDCSSPAQPIIIEQSITFTNGSARNVPLKVPCGVYTCATARDRLHTLRRTDNALTVIDGKQYEADFTDENGLISGDLNDDGIIDIIDWAIFAGQFLSVFGSGDTPCGGPWDPAGPQHADISGNGFVFVEEHTFISANFREHDDPNCCTHQGGLAEADDQGTLRISVEDLYQRGLGHLAVADLNGDLFVDEKDMAAFDGGVQPQPVRAFNGKDGDSWFSAEHWDNHLRPDENTDVVVPVDVLVDRHGALARAVRVEPNGSLTITDGSLAALSLTVDSGASLTLDDAGALLQVNSLLVREGATLDWTAGTIEIDGGLFASADTLFVGVEGEGLLSLVNGGQVEAPHVYVGMLGALLGNGSIDADLTNDGLLRPELLSLEGNFEQSPTGTLAIAFGGTLDAVAHDTLHVSGDARLGGTLTVDVAEGFAPQPGDRFEIVSAGAIEGRFARLDLPALADGLRFRVQYGEGSVSLTVIRAPHRPENSLGR